MGWEYEEDPDCDGPMDPSQPCDNIHGVSYTPNGLRRMYYTKKYWKRPYRESTEDGTSAAKRLKFDESQ